METLRNLMNNTPEPVIKRAKLTTAQVLNMEIKKKKDIDTVVFIAKCRGHTETDYYKVEIELYPIEQHLNVFDKPSYNNPVWVSCSCPYWHYFCQYAVVKTGSTDFQHVLSSDSYKAPLIRNREEIPYLCKHLYAAAPKVIGAALIAARQEPRFKFQGIQQPKV